MNQCAKRDSTEWQGISEAYRGIRSGGNLHSDRRANWGDDVTFLAIDIVNKRDVGAASGIVLKLLYDPGNAMLVAVKVDFSQPTLVPAPPVSDRNPAVRITSSGFTLSRNKALLRLVFSLDSKVNQSRHEPSRRGIWFILLYWHFFLIPADPLRRISDFYQCAPYFHLIEQPTAPVFCTEGVSPDKTASIAFLRS